MASIFRRCAQASVLAGLTVSLGACAASGHGETTEKDGAIDNLTSLTALPRKLTFSGYVYVQETATESDILGAVRQQTQSAFGALRAANVAVSGRELKNVDAATFLKVPVIAVDPANVAAPQKMTMVAYTYTDDAVVPRTMSEKSALSLALLGKDYASQNKRILQECTNNDSEAREFLNSIWYVFNPSGIPCSLAMTFEQIKIGMDRMRLAPGQVPLSEVQRLYLPMTATLRPITPDAATRYPEYDRLYSGGIEPGTLSIGMVSGLMANWAAGEHHDTVEDAGYPMWLQGLREIFKTRAGLALASVEPNANVLSYTLGALNVTFGSFEDLIAFELDTKNPPGVTAENRGALRKLVADTLVRHWLTFRGTVSVTMRGTTNPVTIKLQSYFGSETDIAPYKRAIKTSDVFIYNGHSYIGYGPLDPSRFDANDFPPSYQLFAINGCVSYNYYGQGYFPLKPGGTKNLDVMSNGLESWVDESGPAMGRFVGALIDGKQSSYRDILKASQFTFFGYSWGMDALRVVDGDLDNVYSPETTPIVVR